MLQKTRIGITILVIPIIATDSIFVNSVYFLPNMRCDMLENSQTGMNYMDVSNVIMDRILRGELKRGDKLPTERELAKQLNVSRPSVREAFKALQLMGIFESRQGSGTYITCEPENTINDPLAIVYALSDANYMDLQQFRLCLESGACRGIIMKATDEEIDTLERYLSPDMYSEFDLTAMSENDTAFHSAIINMSHNVIIKYLYKTLWLLINEHIRDILLATYQQQEIDVVRKDHVSLYRALKKRNYGEVSDALMHHFYLNEEYRRLLDKSRQDD